MIGSEFEHPGGYDFAGLKPAFQNAPERAALGEHDDGRSLQCTCIRDWAVLRYDERQFLNKDLLAIQASNGERIRDGCGFISSR